MTTTGEIFQMEFSPLDQRVMETLCEGGTNHFIARSTGQTLRAIENTITRIAKTYGIKSDDQTNMRISLSLAYRRQFGDKALKKLVVP